MTKNLLVINNRKLERMNKKIIEQAIRIKELEEALQEKNKEQEEKNKEEIAKEKIADAIDKVDNELDDAEYKGDKHIKAARSIANSIIKYSEPKGEQVKREVNKKSEELPSANS